MVDPLGLNAGMFPGTQGAPGLSALDIALYQVPTMQLDKVYGGDPWMMMNRGALNAHEAQLAGRQRVAEAVSGLLAVRRYKYYLGLEQKREAAEAAKEDAYNPGRDGFNGISYPYPEDGLFRLGNYTYDLASFIKFFKQYAKKFGNPVYSVPGGTESMEEPVLNGEPTKLYAEVSSYLTEELDLETMSTKISYTTPDPKSGKKGTSGYFNKVYPDDAFVPFKNRSAMRIHIHPFGGEYFNLTFIAQRNPFGGQNRMGQIIDFGASEPSPRDHQNALFSNFYYRYVVINSAYIYLYNKNPNETIRIDRP